MLGIDEKMEDLEATMETELKDLKEEIRELKHIEEEKLQVLKDIRNNTE